MDCNHCHLSLCVEPDTRMTVADHDRLLASVSHLHTFGPRVLAEFVIEFAQHVDGTDCALVIATQYNERLSPELLRAAGADRMPSPALRLVPDDFAGRAEYWRTQACQSDRRADIALQHGDHREAERLSRLAEKMRRRGGAS